MHHTAQLAEMVSFQDAFQLQLVEPDISATEFDVTVHVFPEDTNIMLLLYKDKSKMTDAYSTKTFQYSMNASWNMIAERTIDNIPNGDVDVVPLSTTSELIVNKHTNSLSHLNSTIDCLEFSSLEHAVVCRLSENKFAICIEGQIRLYSVDGTGFTLHDSADVKHVDGCVVCSSVSFLAWGYGAYLVNIENNKMSFVTVTNTPVRAAISLSSTSFVFFIHQQYDIILSKPKVTLLYSTINDKTVDNINIYKTDISSKFLNLCKLSATSFLIYSTDFGQNSCVMFYKINNVWSSSKENASLKKLFTGTLMFIHGLQFDNSFVCITKGRDDFYHPTLSVTVFRQIEDLEIPISTIACKERNGSSYHRYISSPTPTNHICITYTELVGWIVFDLNKNETVALPDNCFNVFKQDSIRMGSTHAAFMVHPYIVIVRNKTVTFYDYMTGKKHKQIEQQFYINRSFQLDNCVCTLNDSYIELIYHDKHDRIKFANKKNWENGFSNNKNALMLFCRKEKSMFYFTVRDSDRKLVYHRNYNLDYQIAELGTIQWDYDGDGLNFFYEEENEFNVMHAVLDISYTFTSEKIIESRDLGRNMFYMISGVLNTVERPVCIVSPYYMLSIQAEYDDLTIYLIQICPLEYCVIEQCAGTTKLTGTRCEACKSSLPLQESKCDDLNKIPTCVPQIEDSGETDITTLPKGTLLFHGTKATCSKHQDPSNGAVHKVFYEEGKTPKTEGLIYFCVNPWISLTRAFYYRQENSWGSDGAYSSLIANNKEREILANAVNNGLPGAVCVYKLTQDIKLLNTTQNNTRFKKQFCEDIGLECPGPKLPFQYNDFGMVCWAINNGCDGMLSISQNDTIKTVEKGHLYNHAPITTVTDKGDTSEETDIPFITDIGFSAHTWEIVLTDFESKMELVTWIDACPSKSSPPDIEVKTDIDIYTEMKKELQTRPECNIWKPIGLPVEILLHNGDSITTFVNINAICKNAKFQSDMFWFIRDAYTKILDTVYLFVKDVVGHTQQFSLNIPKMPKFQNVTFTDKTTWSFNTCPEDVSYCVIEPSEPIIVTLDSHNSLLLKQFDQFKLVKTFPKDIEDINEMMQPEPLDMSDIFPNSPLSHFAPDLSNLPEAQPFPDVLYDV